MFKSKKVLAITLALVFIVGSFSGVMAATTIIKIQAEQNTKAVIKINGNTVDLRDANKSKIFPIMYKGKQYLPADVFALIGKAYNYDSKTVTSWIGEKPGKGVDLLKVAVKGDYDYYTDACKTLDKKLLEYNGKTFACGFVFKSIKNSSENYAYYDYNLNNKYQKLNAVLVSKSGSPKFIFKDLDSNVELQSVILNEGESSVVSVDIGAVKNLRIYVDVSDSDGNTNGIIAEPYLK
ncbi:MAG TPA: hypothetical protein VHT34_13840 [Clostridia bacterium]|nr:hypothetical protein [Clostridia bacterium]